MMADPAYNFDRTATDRTEAQALCRGRGLYFRRE